MSSKITSIRNQILTEVASGLSGYMRIPNPYAASDNLELFLNKGYGVAIGNAERIETDLCHQAFRRFFTVVLTRVAAATANDITTRDAIEIALCEDVKSIRSKLENNNQLSGNAIRTDYVGDSGIEFVVNTASNFKFYAITVNFFVDYQEEYS